MTRRYQVGIDIEAENNASREIDAVSRSLQGMGGQAHNTGQRMGILGSITGTISQGIFMGVGMAGAMAFGKAVGMVPNAVIGMNAQLEKSQLQFETLFKDADRAREHVAMLFEFAKNTPFETGPIIEASRMLQTFGGDGLNTAKNLTMIGDAAAGASTDINNVAFWVGRAYSAIQGGQPFGEARMRLQELALLSPKAAQEMERLQKSGASAAEVWAVMEGELGKFGGSMEKQAGTWDGLMSTMMDTVNLTLATAFKPLFESMKTGMEGAIELFSSPAFASALTAMGNGAMTVLGAIGDAFSILWSIAQPILSLFSEALNALFGDEEVSTGAKSMGKAVGGIVQPVSDLTRALQPLADMFALYTDYLGEQVENFGYLADAVTGLFDAFAAGEELDFSMFMEAFSDIVEAGLDFVADFGVIAMDAIGAFISNVIDNLPAMTDALLLFANEMVNWVLNVGVPMAADALGKLADKFIEWIGVMLPKLGAALPAVATKILDFVLATLPKLAAKLLEWGAALIGWILPRLPDLLAKLASFVGSLASWLITTGLPRVLAAAGELGLSLVKGFLQFVIGPPGLLERVMDFLNNTLAPAIRRFGPSLLKAGGDIGQSFINGVINFLKKLPGIVADMVRKAFAGININIGPFHITSSGITIDMPSIPGFAVGAWRLPTDMLAQVHKDEMIIPADIARRLRGEGAGATTGPTSFQSGGNTGGGTVIYQTFHIGPGAVRSDEDIRRLGREFQERAALQGYTATTRQVGRSVA